jgi:hypothetical protein
LFQIFTAVASDYLWFVRNKAHHADLILNALVISFTINKTVLEHHVAWKNSLAISREIWQPPSPPFFKINYDTAIIDIFSTQAAVCRDSRGTIIRCVSIISSPCSLSYSEALATLLASQLATSLGLFNFILQGDSLMVTQALQLPTITKDWRIALDISVIHFIIPPFTNWTVPKINRSANFCAYYVTN